MKNLFLISGAASLGVLVAQLASQPGTTADKPGNVVERAPRLPNRHEARRLAKMERDRENDRRP